MLSIGWSDFALGRHVPGTGFSYCRDNAQVLTLLGQAWEHRKPGHGETGLDRKVVVPVPPAGFYCPPRVPLQPNMPLYAKATQRQPGEDPYVEVYTLIDMLLTTGFEFKPERAKSVEVVCYSKESLLENNGTRSTDAEWEIVAVLCHGEEEETMEPLTMARNYLQKVGGTFTDYSAKQFAEAIYQHACTSRKIKVLGEWNPITVTGPNPYFD